MKTSILVFTAGIALIFDDAFACGPGGGSKGKSGGHGGGVGGGGVGVGINIDLGGVGQRRREADPFAPRAGSPPVAHSQKKPETTKQRPPSMPSDFANVELIGEKAKAELEPLQPLNISSANQQMPPSAPQNSKDFTKAAKATGNPREQLQVARDACRQARKEYLEKQPNWKAITNDLAEGQSTEKDNRKGLAAYQEMQKLIDQFNASEGKNLIAAWKSAYANAAKAGEKIEDYIPPP